ncbi:hypothetical protein BDF20DRAFT_839273 [Mycotypha africana]|uniref:uncharacterized protein n=1 Tax=Mycotypha africana TaxID=64632 RepID=UPI0022FFEEA3|nr:uncharacterized protein BDF20DRAFT_839273 [Mycotypha africana]KAI8969342.1 hypothetical protein BDF20DRAFT_839273 [Mycotypha africana]
MTPVTITALPFEVLYTILQRLSKDDLIRRCAFVSKTWCCVARSLYHPWANIRLKTDEDFKRFLNNLLSASRMSEYIKSIQINLMDTDRKVSLDRHETFKRILSHCQNLNVISFVPIKPETKDLMDTMMRFITNCENSRDHSDSSTCLPNLEKIHVNYTDNMAVRKTYILMNYLCRSSIRWIRLEFHRDRECLNYVNQHYGGLKRYLTAFRNLNTLHLLVGFDQEYPITELLDNLLQLEVFSLHCPCLYLEQVQEALTKQYPNLKNLTISAGEIDISILPFIRYQFPNLETLCVLGTLKCARTSVDVQPSATIQDHQMLDDFVEYFAKSKNIKGLYLQLDYFTNYIRRFNRVGMKLINDFHNSFSDTL